MQKNMSKGIPAKSVAITEFPAGREQWVIGRAPQLFIVMQLSYQLNHYMMPGLLLIKMRTFKNTKQFCKDWNLFKKANFTESNCVLSLPPPSLLQFPGYGLNILAEIHQETMRTSKNTTKRTCNQQISFPGHHLWFHEEWH